MSIIATCNACPTMEVCDKHFPDFINSLLKDGWVIYVALSFCPAHAPIVADIGQNAMCAITVEASHLSDNPHQIYRCADGKIIGLRDSFYLSDVNVGDIVSMTLDESDHYVAKKLSNPGSSLHDPRRVVGR